MKHLNIEIKARSTEHERIRQILESESAEYVGRDHQIDTYFHVRRGRLKLREGDIEQALIYYDRVDEAGPKRSDVLLYQPHPGSMLKKMLSDALGVKVIVDKQRDIYFVANVKFHLDEVSDLGSFVEIEAIDSDGTRSRTELQTQCERYLNLFGINQEALVSVSYSDLLLQNEQTSG